MSIGPQIIRILVTREAFDIFNFKIEHPRESKSLKSQLRNEKEQKNNGSRQEVIQVRGARYLRNKK